MFLSEIKDEEIPVDWLLQKIQRSRVSFGSDAASDSNVLFWRGHNKALTDLAAIIERKAKKQVRDRRAGAELAPHDEDETQDAPPG